ncbi:MAG: hypothetical protein REH83_00645 [Rickettsiella sp.]|nr:hypothetical protein [Rickettsiella sp.]
MPNNITEDQKKTEGQNLFIKNFNKFRSRKGKKKISSKVVETTSTSGQQQESKLENIKFIKSEVPTENEQLVEKFIKLLISSALPVQVPRENYARPRYAGLASLAIISELFFNSKLKITIENMDKPNDAIKFAVDIKMLEFEKNDLSLDKLKRFVASENDYSIKMKYFQANHTSVSSLDWANFRIEINETIFSLVQLSDIEISDFLEQHFKGDEKNEYNKVLNSILVIKENTEFIKYLKETKNEKYAKYIIEKSTHQTTIDITNREEAILSKGYRKSQIFHADGKNINFFTGEVKKDEEISDTNNNNFSSTPSCSNN